MPIAQLDSPTYPTFRTYLLSNTPVILSAPATSSWPAFKSWLVDGRVNFAHLRATYGDEDVFAFDCSSGASTEGKFGQTLDLWEKGEGAGVYVKVRRCLPRGRGSGVAVRGRTIKGADCLGKSF